jgi:hypothetical protein
VFFCTLAKKHLLGLFMSVCHLSHFSAEEVVLASISSLRNSSSGHIIGNGWTDFHEIWYVNCVIGAISTFYFPAIGNTNVTEPQSCLWGGLTMTPLPMIPCTWHLWWCHHQWCLYTFNNWGMTGLIFMKFGMTVMPMETTPNSYVLISYTIIPTSQMLKVVRWNSNDIITMILCACPSHLWWCHHPWWHNHLWFPCVCF